MNVIENQTMYKMMKDEDYDYDYDYNKKSENIKKEPDNEQDQKLLNNKKQASYTILISVVCIIIWCIIIYTFRKHFINKKYKFAFFVVYLIPIAIIIYHTYYEYKQIMKRTSYDMELDRIKNEIDYEKDIAEVIPILLFGLAAIFEKYSVFIMKKVVPLLLIGTLLGAIIPFGLRYVTFNTENLNRLVFIENIEFCFMTMGLGLISAGIVVPIIELL